ncbi:MAG: hypothetical protein IPK26_26330 [Planctomycetes bacterium]|nr:hypothetical protein [Planctomycetota bacterium]
MNPREGNSVGEPLNVSWSDEELAQLTEGIPGFEDDAPTTLDELAAPRPAKRPAKAKAAPPPPAAEPIDAVALDAAMTAEDEQVPAEGVAADAEAVPADDDAPLLEYQSADGSKIPLSKQHVEALISGTEQALLNERAALDAVQQARAEAAQARQQIEQLGAFVRQGNADAILQLLGVPVPAARQAPLQPDPMASAPDFSQVDWSDPASIQQAFLASNQRMQQSFEARLAQEAQARQEHERSVQQQQQHQQIVGWGHQVDSHADQMVASHPAAAKLSPRHLAAVQRDVRDAVVRAFHAQRISPRHAAQQIQATLAQIVNAEVAAWVTDGRQSLGRVAQQAVAKAKSMPKAAAPRVTATTMPSSGLTPMGDTHDEWESSILRDMKALSQRSNLE